MTDRFVTTGKSQRAIRQHKMGEARLIQDLLTDWPAPERTAPGNNPGETTQAASVSRHGSGGANNEPVAAPAYPLED
jgi:hypothetical protein